ncbi:MULTISPECIES: hypothetical protein [Leuconostoc gelidum group]|uniref:hypothetical protein n=1 Tax=Leuconostoc gelidum group TaxID=3016637 RepID=UPI00021920EB|nr:MULTISPECIES: hypothetical protein [Leuconostoc gelidum group]AFS39489.1 hypothetical protein C269_00210 [Leuconostoc gelidum JB7]MBZ5953135.1 hypothetical protein [Leuconostoc gasicomitatum]MBZ5968797.1 hypothetical protein [Leuconostoc gasicomitatum]MBZ5984417.1 hypothetical protein [Leuconostoc gasicomitatum]MBZ5988607.1 hypothetical protein [Leuconostoc gasicomitatum]
MKKAKKIYLPKYRATNIALISFILMATAFLKNRSLNIFLAMILSICVAGITYFLYYMYLTKTKMGKRYIQKLKENVEKK